MGNRSTVIKIGLVSMLLVSMLSGCGSPIRSDMHDQASDLYKVFQSHGGDDRLTDAEFEKFKEFGKYLDVKDLTPQEKELFWAINDVSIAQSQYWVTKSDSDKQKYEEALQKAKSALDAK